MSRGSTKRSACFAVVCAVAGVLAAAPAASAAVRADFDKDGTEDLAIGIEGEDLAGGAQLNCGAAEVIYGTEGEGLDAVGPPSDQLWHEDVAGVRGECVGDDGFGAAVAAGDFDGDKRADLAIGASGNDVGGEEYAGSVHVLYGGNNGLNANGDDFFTENTKGVPGKAKEEDELGAVVAGGDFDGDGFDDLAATVRDQRVDGKEQAGAILVFFGSSKGLRTKGVELWTQQSRGIGGGAAAFDQFGFALAAGDFNHDRRDDLVAGTPFDDINGVGAGSVNIIRGSKGGLTSKHDVWLHQGLAEVPDAAIVSERFGASLAAGRIDGDKRADLAIGVPANEITGVDRGAAVVLYAAKRGLANADAELWDQESADVEGVAEDGDEFGSAVAIGDFNDDGFGDLGIGTESDTAAATDNAGAVNVLYGTGLAGRLTAIGDQLFTQATTGVPGTTEVGDDFGATLAAGDFKAEDGDDLAIGVLFDDAGAVDGGGSVNILHGINPGGLTGTGAQLFNEDSPDIGGTPTASEFFSFSLASGT